MNFIFFVSYYPSMCCNIEPSKLKQSSESQFAMSSNHGRMKVFIIKKYFKLIELDDAMWP